MNRNQGVVTPFALLAGTFWLADGIWGLFSPITFGVLSTNRLHTLIHIVLGVVSLYLARRSAVRPWMLFTGIVVLSAGVLRFIPATSDLVVSMINVNMPVAILNLVVGTLAIIVSRMSPAVDLP